MVRTVEPTGEELTCPDGLIDAFAAAAGNDAEQTDEDDEPETPRELAAGLGLPDPPNIEFFKIATLLEQ